MIIVARISCTYLPQSGIIRPNMCPIEKNIKIATRMLETIMMMRLLSISLVFWITRV